MKSNLLIIFKELYSTARILLGAFLIGVWFSAGAYLGISLMHSIFS